MDSLNKLLRETGVVPVVVIDNADAAVPLAEALVAGGLPIIEVTLRTGAAPQAIANIAKQVPEAVIGAGTVLNEQQFHIAKDAGAGFMVSPGLYEPLVSVCKAAHLPIYPGIATATELQAACNLGLDTVKFFPAGLSGGVPMLKALSAVFANMQFMPTGGVSADNLADYLALPSVVACGGSWLTPRDLVANGDFAEITRLAATAKNLAMDARAAQ